MVRYGAAVALASLAVLVRKLLPLGPDVAVGIYPLPIAAVLASAWYFGRGAALLAILASTLGLAYAYVPPVDSSGVVWTRVFGLLLFVVVAGFAGPFAAARRVAEEALTESEARFRLTAENLPEVLWLEALEPRRILYVSPSYERIWGHTASELYRDAHRWLEAIHPDDRASVSASFMRWLAGGDGRPYDVEYRVARPDGTIRWIHDRGALIRDHRGRPYRASGVAEDITERKQMEDRLRASEQMWRAAMMGELAGAIAHEVNQPLAAIVAHANASLRWLAHQPPDFDEARQAMASVVREGIRAGEIIARVRAMTRKSAAQRESLDVNDLLRDVVALARAQALASRVAVKMELSPTVPRVLGDRVQVQQVALNLIVNGIEAIGRTVDGPRDLVIRSATDGPRHVVVSVADSGAGLESTAAERLFEPFFTTTPRGMGMGLAVSRSIVESHGGRIWATGTSPRGALFLFTLPAGAEPS